MRGTRTAGLVIAALFITGCSWFGGDDDDEHKHYDGYWSLYIF